MSKICDRCTFVIYHTSCNGIFSRMRSEGFPFIVGVWGWTCVRVVLVVSSSCRRRCVINFSPLGGTHALRHNPFLQSMKSGGSLARNDRGGFRHIGLYAFSVSTQGYWAAKELSSEKSCSI